MHYWLDFSDEALGQLRVLPREIRRRIGRRLDVQQQNLQGNVRKLAGQAGKYRLRVGEFRVLCTLEKT